MSNRPKFPGPGGGNRDDEDDDKGRPAGGGSRFSSPANRGSFPGKPDDRKKDDRPGASKPGSSGFGSRSPFLRDDDDEDEEEEKKDNKPSFGRPGGFGSGSKPAFGKADDEDEDDADEDEDDDRLGPSRSTSGSRTGGSPFAPKPSSPFGGKPGEPSKTGFGGNKPGDKPGGSSPFGSRSTDQQQSRPGSPFGGNKPGDKPGGSSAFGSKPGGAFGSNKPGGSSTFGGKPSDQDKKDDKADKKDDRPGGGPFNRSPFGGKPGDKPADKKDEKKDDKPGGGPLGRLPFGGGKPADKPADKKDDKPGGGPLGRLPFGGSKPADKPADKKDDKPGGGPFGRLPFGGSKPADKPADKKDDKPGGGPFGRLPFGGGSKPADQDKKDDKPAASGPFGRSPAGGKPADTPAQKTADKDKPAGGGVFGRLPFGNKPADQQKKDDKSAARPAEPKRTTGALPSASASGVAGPLKSATTAPDLKKPASKVPPARGEKVAKPLERAPKQVTIQQGLSLDQKLDLVGIALIITGGLIFFAVVPQTSEGSITRVIANILRGAFGEWPARVLWIPPLGAGLWLYIQRFNENPLIIKSHRLIGYGLLLLTLATTAHFLELLQKPVVTMAQLVKVSDAAAKAMHGGGWVGGELYKLLMNIAGEWGTPVLLIGSWVIALMLAFSITLSEVAIYVKSVVRWFARVRNSYVEHRRAAAQAKAAATPPLTIEKPAPAGAISAGATPAAATLASPTKAPGIPERTGVQEPASSPRLAPAGSKPENKAASAGERAKPFGQPPATTAVVDEELEEAELENEQTPPVTRPAPFGSRASTPVADKPAQARTDSKASPAKPSPFGVRPGPAKTAEPASADGDDEEELDENEAAPIVKPSPVASRQAPGAVSGTATSAKPASPFAPKPAEEKSEKPVEPGVTNAARSTTPFGAKPTGAPSTQSANEDGEEEPARAGDEKPASAAVKPATPFGNRPSPFGGKPADNAAKPGGSPSGKSAPKAEDVDEADEADEDVQGEKATNTPVKPGMPTGGQASLFGKPPVKSDEGDEDEPDEEQNQKPVSTAFKPAAPIGNRPNPFGGKPTDTPAKPSGSLFGKPAPKPAQDKPADADELDEEQDQGPPASTAFKPAVPVGNRPNPFGGKPADTPPKPSGSPFGKPAPKPAEDKLADEDEPDEEQDQKPASTAFKPAAPIGNRPNPFGGKPADSPDKPGGSPFGKPAPKSSDAADDVEDEKPSSTAFKPATPIGNRPSPFGSTPPAVGPKPAPKPGSAPRPAGAATSEQEADDSEPKYVNLDDADSAGDTVPPSGGSAPKQVADRTSDPSASSASVTASAPHPAATGTDNKASGSSTTQTESTPTAQAPAVNTAKDAAKNAADSKAPIQAAATSGSLNAAPVKAEMATTKPDAVQPAPPKADGTTTTTAKTPGGGGSGSAAPTITPESKTTPEKAATPADGKTPPPLEGVIVRSRGAQGWEMPDFGQLLEPGSQQKINDDILQERARVIEETLQSFGAPGKVVEINPGPVITQFGVEPDHLVSRQGKKTRVKVSSIARLDADLALALAARSIRIEAPVPGKGYVGIEVPNAETALVGLRDVMEAPEFQKINSKLRIALGLSVDGAPIAADLTMMPHLLIAGTTGSGKSVCVNAIISCLLLMNSPDDLKLIMVDPKRVELTGYNGIPHLISPVVVDLERIVGVLKWVSREMDERYKKFSQAGARNILDYNNRIGPSDPKLPYLVVVVDELADLMMLAPEETEKVLTRLAQMARATGIHLIISTQRPSVDVVTGLIKANFPARISFAVASSVDSRVILDQPGAEKLLGRGDMLYQSPDAAAPLRMQGVFVSDAEITRITRFWKGSSRTGSDSAKTATAPSNNMFESSKPAEPVQSRTERFAQPAANTSLSQRVFGNVVTEPEKPVNPGNGDSVHEDDELYEEAVELVKRMNKASISLLQRRLRIGYTRAARLIELMVQRGVINAADAGDAGREDGGDKE